MSVGYKGSEVGNDTVWARMSVSVLPFYLPPFLSLYSLKENQTKPFCDGAV